MLKVIPELLNYQGSLQSITLDEVKSMKGIGRKTVPYLFRVLSGEDVNEIIYGIDQKFRYYSRETQEKPNRKHQLEILMFLHPV